MHKPSILLALMLSMMVLTSCSSVPQSIAIKSAPLEKPNLELPSVDRFSQRPLNWIVLTHDNVEDVFEELKNENKQIVVFAVDEKGYEALTLNVTDLLKLVKQQNAVITAYKQYYEKEQ